MTSAARIRVAVLSACSLLIPFLHASAQGNFQVPAYTGYVNDFAGVLTPETRATLTGLSERINAATRGDMVIVTIADIGDRAESDVALEIGRQWKVGANAAIGDRARNAGVVILLVPKESSSINRGACRIEVGQGSEGFITDATSGSICREATPYFAQRDYSRGMELVAARVAQRYAQEFNVALDGVVVPEPQSEPTRRRGNGGGNAVLVIIVVVILLSSIGKRGRGGRGGCLNMLPFLLAASSGGGHSRGGWGGGGGGFGGGGGGFGGFGGGGGFSGGGGGSNW
ncbi:MAG: TPM domain-containing protein [Phycisphaerae bacterium]|nr:TPM domain-containing protein [Gemmatimonadaceae bacterium]